MTTDTAKLGMEMIGLAATVVALAGVILNNHRIRWCFVLWWFSNAASGGLHVAAGMWSLAIRDLAFLVLAVHGWRCWGKDTMPQGDLT